MKLKTMMCAALVLASTGMPALAIMPALPVVVDSTAPDLAGQKRPSSFALYATTDIGDGTSCVVGADATAAGGKRAAVLRIDNKTGEIVWNRSLIVPGDVASGSRATHCTAANGSLYVLIQRDLLSPYEQPAGFVAAARLGLDGAFKAGGHVNLPAAQAVDSTDGSQASIWIETGLSRLQIANHLVVIKARYAVSQPAEAGSSVITVTEPRDVEIRLDDEVLMPVQ